MQWELKIVANSTSSQQREQKLSFGNDNCLGGKLGELGDGETSFGINPSPLRQNSCQHLAYIVVVMPLKGSTHFTPPAIPSVRQTQAQAKIVLLGSLCHTSDNAELHLKEIVLFIHACLGVDRQIIFHRGKVMKQFMRLILCTYIATKSIYSHRCSNTPQFHFSPQKRGQTGQKYFKYKQIKRCHTKSGSSRDCATSASTFPTAGASGHSHVLPPTLSKPNPS